MDIVFEETPIFTTRAVVDAGGMMTGGAAHVGNDGRDRRDALLHELPRVQDVGARIELELDRRQLRHGLRAHEVQPVEAVERLLERDADQRLDLGGVQSEADRLDLDARWRELREGVHRHVAQLLHAEEHHRGADEDGEKPELHARADNPTHQRSDPPLLVRYDTAALARQSSSMPPYSTPHNSVAPTVTTAVPGAGPLVRIARSPSMRSTVMSARTNTSGFGLV